MPVSDDFVVVATCLEDECPYHDTLVTPDDIERYYSHIMDIDHTVQTEKLRGQVNQ